jgi:hypothetical protein
MYTVYTYSGYNVSLTVTDDDGLTDTAYLVLPVWYAGDANGDRVVNIVDAAVLGLHWNSVYGEPGYDDGGDLNNDGVVNIVDAALVGLNWGTTV